MNRAPNLAFPAAGTAAGTCARRDHSFYKNKGFARRLRKSEFGSRLVPSTKPLFPKLKKRVLTLFSGFGRKIRVLILDENRSLRVSLRMALSFRKQVLKVMPPIAASIGQLTLWLRKYYEALNPDNVQNVILS